MKTSQKLILSIVIIVLAYLSGGIFGKVYLLFFDKVNTGVMSIPKSAVQYIIGWPLAYIFLSTLLFTAFGGIKKYWWIGILLVPAVLFELYFDWIHLYFPIAIGLVGWGLGFGVEKSLKMIKK